MIKNPKNITIEQIENHYNPETWDSCDLITNLSDQTTGAYAYELQEYLQFQKTDLKPILQKQGVLIARTLEKIIAPINNYDFEVRYKNEHGLNNFELLIRVQVGSVAYPILIRNGYLLKVLKEGNIKSFDDLQFYNAVIIFNNAKINPEPIAFVGFKKWVNV